MNGSYLQGDTAEILDFYRIRKEVASYAVCEEARDLLLSREATSDAPQISRLKTLSREWGVYDASGRPSPFGALPPARSIIDELRVPGVTLSQEKLFALGLLSHYSLQTVRLIQNAAEALPLPALSSEATRAPSLKVAEREIFFVLEIETGEVRNLPPLKAIRTRIASLKSQIASSLRHYTRDAALKTALQSPEPVLRGGREVLAVRADRSGAVKGVVHEVSVSGQTLYIEPAETLELENRLLEEETRLQSEILKLLRELSEKIRPFCADFASAADVICLLDATHAAALYGKNIRGVFPEDGATLSIINARHPLLKESAVPVTIEIPQGKRAVVITGPNAGGKTLALKTAGLFALMNQAGFPVPADEGTALPLFDAVFCDIGDSQSIDEELSTFSGSMTRLSRALSCATDKSLVLYDEAGSGTDPLEGGAIAIAVLAALLGKGPLVLATTHHGSLKNFAFTDARCVNACVEFNGHPTYRLLMGTPGESHALEIAAESGIPDSVIKDAGRRITRGETDIGMLIRGLTEARRELTSLTETEREKLEELAEKEAALKEREADLLERSVALKERENAESRAFLSETRSRLENLVRTLREGEITREKTLAVKGFIADVEKGVEGGEEALSEEKERLTLSREELSEKGEAVLPNGMKLTSLKNKGPRSKKRSSRPSNSEALKSARPISAPARDATPKPFEPGRAVLLYGDNREGTLVKKQNDGKWQVLFGSVTMQLDEKDLRVLATSSGPPSYPSFIYEKDIYQKPSARPAFELRLLGMRREEALKALERQLDLCVMEGVKSFSVIHGKGDGVLRQAVSDYLNNCPAVKDFRFAPPEDGGAGKTYVDLY